MTSRSLWLVVTWLLTWPIPTILIRTFGRKTNETQIAWREKLALCLIILLLSGVFLFLIVGLGLILCPRTKILSEYEIAQKATINKPLVQAYGYYYEIPEIVKSHVPQHLNEEAFKYTTLGKDVSAMFVKTDHFEKYCPGIQKPSSDWSNIVRQVPEDSMTVWYIHRTKTQKRQFYDFLGRIDPLKKGAVARDKNWIQNYLQADPERRYIIVAYGRVYGKMH